MIPKKIHYCWFGRNPLPETAIKCINSWKKYCPDYEIIQWNEDNFDLDSAPLYVREAYREKKWAFLTDYARLQIIYENGGLYFDTDVEVIKSFDDLLSYNAFFGHQNPYDINTGLGMGAVAECPIVREIMDDYKDIPFVLPDGTYDTTPCPERNTKPFMKYGLKTDNSFQVLDGNIAILPSDYLNPKDFMTLKIKKTKNTYSIHHFSSSWFSDEANKEMRIVRKNYKKSKRKAALLNFIKRIIGTKLYNKIKKRGC